MATPRARSSKGDAWPEAGPEALDELPDRSWIHVGPPLAGLDHWFRIQTTDADLGAFLDDIFSGLAVDDAPTTTTVYSLVTDAPGPWRHRLYIDGRRAVVHHDPAYVLGYLLWHVNRQAVSRTTDRVLLHAAGVTRDGLGIVLAAEAEGGKTTLAAGLVKRGYGYLTDEAVAIDPDSLLIRPFAKSLSIDQGSWTVLPDLKPDLSPAVRPFVREQWHVPVTAIRSDALAESVPPRLILTPEYRAGEKTELQPLGRAETLVKLAKLTFDFRARPRRNLRVLADTLARCHCYRLVVGDLEAACELIDSAVDALVTPNGSSEERAR
jgi:hypothetical protein